MPPNDNSPRNEADRQARGALAGAVEWFATNGIVLPTWADLNKRTAERIWKGQRDVPPGLARAIATEIRKEMTRCRDSEHPKLEGWAMALELWAEDCEHRAQGPG